MEIRTLHDTLGNWYCPPSVRIVILRKNYESIYTQIGSQQFVTSSTKVRWLIMIKFQVMDCSCLRSGTRSSGKVQLRSRCVFLQ